MYRILHGKLKFDHTHRNFKAFCWSVVLWLPIPLIFLLEVVDDFKIRRYKRLYQQIAVEVAELDHARFSILSRLDDAVTKLEVSDSSEALSSMLVVFGELKANKEQASRARLDALEKEIGRLGSQFFFVEPKPKAQVMLEFSRVFYRNRNRPEVKFAQPPSEYLAFRSRATSTWSPTQPEETTYASLASPNRIYKFDSDSTRNRSDTARREEWSTYFSSSFKKDVSLLDRRLQGRLMNAILEIAEQPTEAHGDTQKPLTGNLAGKWRYRLGDYRVVYVPNTESFVIVFLRCASRGEVYH